jgi:hypothetical protein
MKKSEPQVAASRRSSEHASLGHDLHEESYQSAYLASSTHLNGVHSNKEGDASMEMAASPEVRELQGGDVVVKPPVVKTVLYKKFDPSVGSAGVKRQSSCESNQNSPSPTSLTRYKEGQLVQNVQDNELLDYATNMQVRPIRPQSTAIRNRPNQIGHSPQQHETINTLALNPQNSMNSINHSNEPEAQFSGQYEILQDTKSNLRNQAARTNIKVNQKSLYSDKPNTDLVNIDYTHLRNNNESSNQQSQPYLS